MYTVVKKINKKTNTDNILVFNKLNKLIYSKMDNEINIYNRPLSNMDDVNNNEDARELIICTEKVNKVEESNILGKTDKDKLIEYVLQKKEEKKAFNKMFQTLVEKILTKYEETFYYNSKVSIITREDILDLVEPILNVDEDSNIFYIFTNDNETKAINKIKLEEYLRNFIIEMIKDYSLSLEEQLETVTFLAKTLLYHHNFLNNNGVKPIITYTVNRKFKTLDVEVYMNGDKIVYCCDEVSNKYALSREELIKHIVEELRRRIAGE